MSVNHYIRIIAVIIKTQKMGLPGDGHTPGEDCSSAIPVLTTSEVMDRLKSRLHSGSVSYKAMYSSVVGGITKDPAAMVLPLDDHMVHRGHSVFDTALIWNGHLYGLDVHLDRLFRSAKKAWIVPPFPKEELRRILIELAAVSELQAGSLRYYVSAGPGSFNLSMAECVGSTFYAVALDEDDHCNEDEHVKVITSSVAIKPPQFATVKSTNYLPNAMVLAEANQKDAYTGIWVDEEGFIGEAPNMNVAFVSAEGTLLVPSFERILAGCTAHRMLELADKLIEGDSPLLREVQVRKVTVDEAKRAVEMFLISSGILIKSVSEWDDTPVGNGCPGPVSKALLRLLEADRDSASYPHRVEIPYK